MVKKILIIFLLFILFSIFFSTNVFAADPKLISKLDDAFEDIKDWLIKLATPAAAVAVGTGNAALDCLVMKNVLEWVKKLYEVHFFHMPLF